MTIAVEHLGATVSITVWQWFSTADAVGVQLAQALNLGSRETTISLSVSLSPFPPLLSPLCLTHTHTHTHTHTLSLS
eukprot:COSAG03_NODE_12076_length_562_cov_0.995680_1_plen_76_part_01